MLHFRMIARAVAVGIFLAAIGCLGQSAQSEPAAADPQIAAALRQVSPQRIQANIEKLVSFGTRLTLSAQDPASIATGHGIGAAREWIKAEFERYSKECGGCLEVKTDSFTEEPTERSMDRVSDQLNRSVEELELSVRSYNCLKNAGIQTIGELVQKSESEMLRTKNFGRKSLNEIKEILQTMGLALGMKPDAHGRLIAPPPPPPGSIPEDIPEDDQFA